MKNKNIISPIGLKGNQINERMKELMGISSINENKTTYVVELTKMGPDGKAYAIVRENHEYYIKSTTKTSKIVAEDFKYIGGLQNKKSEAYPSYAKAIKHLNLRFNSLAEAFNIEGEVNAFLDDNLLSEDVAGFQQYQGNGFSNEGNMEHNTPIYEEMEEEGEDTKNNPWAICTASVGRENKEKFESCVTDVKKQKGINEGYDDEPYYDDVKGKPSKRWDADDAEDIEDDDAEDDLTEAEQAVEDMMKEELIGNQDEIDANKNNKIDADDFTKLRAKKDGVKEELTGDQDKLDVDKDGDIEADDLADLRAKKDVNEHKLSIARAIESMDSIIDSLTEGRKKKVYTLK